LRPVGILKLKGEDRIEASAVERWTGRSEEGRRREKDMN